MKLKKAATNITTNRMAKPYSAWETPGWLSRSRNAATAVTMISNSSGRTILT